MTENPPEETELTEEPLFTPKPSIDGIGGVGISKGVQDVITLRDLLNRERNQGKIGIMEYMLISDWIDSRTSRKSSPISIDEMAEKIKQKILPPTETSEEMKAILEELKGLREWKTAQEKTKETEQLLRDATQPMRAELDKRDMELKDLKERLDKIGGNPSPNTGVSGIDTFLELHTKLKNAGLIKEQESGSTITTWGPEGLPIKGTVPGPVVWLPWLFNQFKESIVDIIDGVSKRWMQTPSGSTAVGKPVSSSKLIKIPDMPKLETPPPPKIKPPEVEQKESLIKVPERPAASTATEPPKPPEVPEPSEPATPESVEAPTVAVETIAIPSEEELRKMKMPELWKVAGQLRLSKKGRKAEIIQRILDAQKILETDEKKSEEKKSEENGRGTTQTSN